MDKFLLQPVSSSKANGYVPQDKTFPKCELPSDNNEDENSFELLGNLMNVTKLLELAKLPNTNTEIQQIVLSPNFSFDDYRLMEVSPAIANEIESGSAKFVFRGELDDYPVLCSNKTTYLVREADTSNTLMVLSDLHFSKDVKRDEKCLKTIKMETVQMKYLVLSELKTVYLNRLKELLHEAEFQWMKVGEEPEVLTERRKMYTFDELLNVIQLSENELRNALEHLPVINYNGFLRLLSIEFCDRLLMEFIELMDDDNEPDISIHSVNVPSLYNSLKRRETERIIPYDAVEWMVRSHCNEEVKDGVHRFSVNERALCRSKASQLLRAAVRFELSEFEKLMEQLLPEGVQLKIEYLEGLALIDEELERGKTIRYLNVEDLPEGEIERLELLFTLRERWKVTEMRPFLSDICKTDREVNTLLTTQCRVAVINEERVLLGLK
uniref:Sister chromatid cohesion protein DCC1 n=1 Tax=Syphacia muris TaxID=451379 RepID=A0A0N5AFF4_9BILA